MLVRRLEMLPVECVARGSVGFGDGRVLAHRLDPGRRAARGPGRGLAAAVTGVHAVDEGGGGGARRGDRLRFGRVRGRCRSCRGAARADPGAVLRGPRRSRWRPGSSWPTPSSSSGWPGSPSCSATRCLRPIVPLLAGRDLVARVGAALVRQAVRARLADVVRLDRVSPPPELPSDVVEATRERYVTAYEQLTGRTFG